MKKIGIIGPNDKMCNSELYVFGVELGKRIATKDRVIVCGGHGGFMEAVCRGVKESNDSFSGQTIGILPEDDSNMANRYIDISIPTGMGVARNIIIVNTSDIIIAAGGGAGTLSEIAFAWQKGKRVLCITTFDGWASELATKNLDSRASGLLISINSIEEIQKYLCE
jgi:uncharacterized protein (TIGR00725 family)